MIPEAPFIEARDSLEGIKPGIVIVGGEASVVGQPSPEGSVGGLSGSSEFQEREDFSLLEQMENLVTIQSRGFPMDLS
jgi:hypothetical protein